MGKTLTSGSAMGPMGAYKPTSSHAEKLTWFRDQFRPHFDGWIFDPINRLVHSQDALIGFIFMACAIDYLASFWWQKYEESCH